MNEVMLGSDGPENLKILKKRQLGVDFGQYRQTVGLSIIEADSWSWGPTMKLKLSSDNDVEKLGSDHEVEDFRLDHGRR